MVDLQRLIFEPFKSGIRYPFVVSWEQWIFNLKLYSSRWDFDAHR